MGYIWGERGRELKDIGGYGVTVKGYLGVVRRKKLVYDLNPLPFSEKAGSLKRSMDRRYRVKMKDVIGHGDIGVYVWMGKGIGRVGDGRGAQGKRKGML